MRVRVRECIHCYKQTLRFDQCRMHVKTLTKKITPTTELCVQSLMYLSKVLLTTSQRCTTEISHKKYE